jgi:hypothetical protein
VVLSTQDNPKPEVMRSTPFFLVHCGGMGVEASTRIETELAALAAKYNIDPLRIYATSFSRGGQEILLQAADHPHWFAAIAPVDNDLRNEPGMSHVKILRTPVLQLHGDHDMFRQSGKELFDLMKQAGVPVTWADYAGGHDPRPIWDKTPKVWMTFFAKHVMDPYPKTVEHVATHKRHGRAYWVDATVIKDAGGLKGRFKVSVDKPNAITVQTSQDIAALDIFLCDKLVDMSKPVKVVEGEKTLYEGPSAEKLTIAIRQGEPYGKKARPALWEELTAIGKKAGFAYKPIDLPAAVAALPDTMPPPAPFTRKAEDKKPAQATSAASRPRHPSECSTPHPSSRRSSCAA